MRVWAAVIAVLVVAGCASGAAQTAQIAAPPPPSSSSAPPTTTTTTPPPPVKPTPCQISDGACIQLSTNRTWVVRGDKIVYGPVPITHGMPGHATPVGTFSVLRKVKDEWSRPYNGPMPYSTYFTEDGIAFHEGSLTEPSHGCIHLDRPSAQYYFDNLAVGEAVQVVP